MLVLLFFIFFFFFFFFNDTATTEIYTLSLHDALPIHEQAEDRMPTLVVGHPRAFLDAHRSEEHTSELQSRLHLVCRLLLEQKKQTESYVPLLPDHLQNDDPSRPAQHP